MKDVFLWLLAKNLNLESLTEDELSVLERIRKEVIHYQASLALANHLYLTTPDMWWVNHQN